MESNSKKYLLVFGVFAIVLVTIGASFAFFNYSREGIVNVIKTGNIEFAMLDGDNVLIEKAFPQSDSDGNLNEAYEFTVKNTSSAGTVIKYDVYLLSNNNEENISYFNNEQIKFSLVKNEVYAADTSSTEGRKLSTIDGFDAGVTVGDGKVLENQVIDASDTDLYKLRIWISNDVNYTTEESNGLVNGAFNDYKYSLKVRINAKDGVSSNTPTPTPSVDDEEGDDSLDLANVTDPASVVSIVVADSLPNDLYAMEKTNKNNGVVRLANVVKLADDEEEEDDGYSKAFFLLDNSEAIIAWYTYEDGSYVRVNEDKYPEDTSSKLILYLYSDQPIKLPENSSNLFSDFESLCYISTFNKFDTSNVTNMSSMFYNCTNLNDLSGISEWDTSNVTDMSNMFYGCSNLDDLSDISDWNVSNVNTMSYMFDSTIVQDFSGLSSWNVSSVSNLDDVFGGTYPSTYPSWYVIPTEDEDY